MTVLVVGALHLDVIVAAPRLPGPDETLIGSAVSYAFGGKGGNQAVAAARMGARTAMAGRVGDDGFAGSVLAALDAAGVDRSRVKSVPGATGMSVAITRPDGDYAAVVVSGVNRDIAADVALPADLSVLVLQAEIPMAVNVGLAERLPDAVTLILNAAPAAPLPDALLRRTDILVVNRVEAAMLTGQDAATLDPGAAAHALRDRAARAVIVTLGADGLVLLDGDGLTPMPARAVAAVSSHGAGDAFVGTLAAEVAAGTGLREACAFAVCAAALHVARPVDARARITPADVRRLQCSP